MRHVRGRESFCMFKRYLVGTPTQLRRNVMGASGPVTLVPPLLTAQCLPSCGNRCLLHRINHGFYHS